MNYHECENEPELAKKYLIPPGPINMHKSIRSNNWRFAALYYKEPDIDFCPWCGECLPVAVSEPGKKLNMWGIKE